MKEDTTCPQHQGWNRPDLIRTSSPW